MELSIIVPVYNTKVELLKRCLDSILNNDCNNKIEIIIVDDNSKKGLVKQYKRIIHTYKGEIIFVENTKKGVSSARNLGIKLSSGEYITFIDSDDTVPPTFFKCALGLIEHYKLDTVIGGYTEIYPNFDKKYGFFRQNYILENGEILKAQQAMFNVRNDLFSDNLPFIIGGRIIKKNIVPFFEENLSISEDQIWNYDVLENSCRIGIFSQNWYNYIQNYDSVGHNSRVGYIKKRIPFWKQLKKRTFRYEDKAHTSIYFSKVYLDMKNAVFYAAHNKYGDFKNIIAEMFSYNEIDFFIKCW